MPDHCLGKSALGHQVEFRLEPQYPQHPYWIFGEALRRLANQAQVARIDRKQPDHAGYNPAVSGLSLNYNRVHFEWKRSASGYVTTMDARTNKYRPAVSVAKMKVSNRDLPVYTYKAVGKKDH